MKHTLVLVLGVLLVFGFVSCETDAPANLGTPPLLTDFITLTHEDGVAKNWNPASSFPKGHGINVGIKGSDPDKDIQKFVLTFYEGETKLQDVERTHSVNGSPFTQYIGSFPRNIAGTDYSVEVYAVDAKGNKSNTLKSAAFSVTEPEPE
jgi:hypothetical protein